MNIVIISDGLMNVKDGFEFIVLIDWWKKGQCR